MSYSSRLFITIIVCFSSVLVYSTDVTARHNCEEGHFRVENTSIDVDPPTSCLSMEVVGELKDCEHPQVRIDNQCDTFVKMLDDTQAYCDTTDAGPSECQVIGSGIVGYVNLPWRKVVNTDERQEHRYDVQAENRQTFIFVSFESTRLDDPEGEGEGSAEGGGDEGACSTAPLGGPASALTLLGMLLCGLVGMRWLRRISPGASTRR